MAASALPYPYNLLAADKDTLREPMVHDFFANNPRPLPGDEQGAKWVCDDEDNIMIFNFLGIITSGSGHHHVSSYGTLVDKNAWVCGVLAALLSCPLTSPGFSTG